LNCDKCPSYNRGLGKQGCLKCGKYKDVLVKSSQRKTIRMDPVPQNVLEAIAQDIDPKTQSIHEAIRMLYTAGLTQEQAAKILNISQKQVSKNNYFALEIIRKIVS
jgi:DNA-directed RNA polymerase specialized sigma subunit